MPKILTFAELLDREMNRARMTPAQLARKAGISLNTVKDALTGKQIPYRSTRVVLADALGRDKEFFEKNLSKALDNACQL
jgi:transcriptional regulator with XRE-family HTH domain